MNLSPKRIALVLFHLFLSSMCFAQTSLQPGDIIISAFNSDNPDQFVFVTLVDLEAGTEIKFTDNGWTGSTLITVEGTYTWTATAAVSKGTKISLTTSALALSVYGDQIFVYQGAASAPNFIFGVSTTPWVNGSISTKTSRKPSTLSTGLSAIAFSTEMDNGYYNQVLTSGTQSEILAMVCNPSHWTRSNSRFYSFPNVVFDVINDSAPVDNEPAGQPTALVLSNFTTYSGNVSFSANPLVEGYIVIRSDNAPLSTLPQDGTYYTLGASIGNGKVVSLGTSLSFVQKGLRANQHYFYTALSYIDSSTSINYRQANPTVASIMTPNDMIGSYYSSVTETAPNFLTSLQARVQSPHVKVTYGNYDETMVTQFEFRDTTGNQKVQECAYSGFTYTYTPPFVWYTTSPFSREHTWAVSWMPSSGSTSSFEYQDQHHLFTVVQNNANGVRSNHPLGNVVQPTNTYLEGKLGYDALGNLVYEPRDEQKGDAARALLYMSLRYDGVGGLDWSFDYLNNVKLVALNEEPQDLATLLSWHAQDAPDDYEMSRNDFIQSIQQNRNPFVDHPEWVNLINFNSMTLQVANSPTVSNFNSDSLIDYKLNVYPNPTSDALWFNLPNSKIATVRLIDMTGRLISSTTIQTEGNVATSMETSTLPSGSYILDILSDTQHQSAIWIKN